MNKLVELHKVMARADQLLWDIYDNSKGNTYKNLGTNLVFPQKEGTIRVSEQEARLAMIKSLDDSPFFYSIETPTHEKYKQKGDKETRASFDLSLYKKDLSLAFNGEFKKGGITSTSKSVESTILKDFEKLLRDPGDGFWFHLLDGTKQKPLGKTIETFNDCIAKLPPQPDKTIVFHLCVLQKKFSIHKEVSIKDYSKSLQYKEGAPEKNGWITS